MKSFTYLSLGGGVQSSVLAEMVAERELSADAVLFADTGDEPDYVHQQVEYLRTRLSTEAPLYVVDNGNIIEDIYNTKGGFAAIPIFSGDGQLRRQCTREYKIKPVEKKVRELLLEKGWARQTSVGAIYLHNDVQITAYLGITLDEAQRMKMNKHKQFNNQYPLIDRKMTRHDCNLWLAERRLPLPKKSSCRICPYHKNEHWRWMKDERPDDWAHVVKIDAHLRNSDFSGRTKGELYLHRSCGPLSDVDLSTPEDHGQTEFFDVCDSGYCYT